MGYIDAQDVALSLLNEAMRLLDPHEDQEIVFHIAMAISALEIASMPTPGSSASLITSSSHHKLDLGEDRNRDTHHDEAEE